MRVLIIPDTHCPGMRRGFPRFLSQIYRAWQCDRVVHIGDLVDWHAINFHGKHSETPGVVREVAEARKQVKQLERLFPRVDWLLGNHDVLPERRADEAGLPVDILRTYSDYWGVSGKAPNGWKVHARWDSLEIDGVLYSHGEQGRQGGDAAWNQARDNAQSTVIGHLHGNAGVKWFANRRRRFFGMSVGCGIDRHKLQFSYGRKFARKPVLGCGVVIDGECAYFEPMPCALGETFEEK